MCGSDLAGLVAAALLGRRGKRVLLCGLGATPPSFTAGGHTLWRQPGILPPPESESVARVLRELNYVQIVRQRAPALQPGFQLVLPGARLDFRSPDDVVERELAREWGAAEARMVLAGLARLRATSATLDPLLGSDVTLPPDGFWERREVARIESKLPPPETDLLAPLPPEHPVRAGMAALVGLTTGAAAAGAGATALARAFDGARRGLHRMDGGLEGLRRLFLERMASSSGEIRERTTPVELVFRRGRVAGLRVRPREETIGLDHLVWAGPVAALLPLSADKALRRLRESAAAAPPALHRYTLCLLVRPDALPEGMGPRVFAVREPARPLVEDNALCITVGETAVVDREPQVPIWVDCHLTAAAIARGASHLSAVRARVRDHLARVMPFFDRHLLVLASPHDGLPAELPGQTASASAVPATPMPALLGGGDEPRALAGLAGFPNATGVKNLILASGETLPGLGVEGELISGWSASRMIAGAQPRREDSGRREILIEDA